MGAYFDELKRAMDYLGEQDDTVFIGQAVEYKGTAMTNTLSGVDREKLVEMPVDEEMQMGMTTGLACKSSHTENTYQKQLFAWVLAQ